MRQMSYYDVLGVDETASDDSIKFSYRQLVKKYHPDKRPEENSEVFQRIQEAYETLIDPEKRKAYDERFFSEEIQAPVQNNENFSVYTHEELKRQVFWANVRYFFRRLFGVLYWLVMTPFLIGLWCFNFVRTFLGLLLFWPIWKFCLMLVFGGILSLFHYVIPLLSEENLIKIMDGYSYHVMGLDLPKETSSSFFMFPYFNVEIWIILVLALLLASVLTFLRD